MNDRVVADGADFARALLVWRSVPGTKIVVFRGGRYQQLALPMGDR